MTSSGQYAGTVVIDEFCKADDDHGNPCNWSGFADVDIDWESNTYQFVCGNGHENTGRADHIQETPC